MLSDRCPVSLSVCPVSLSVTVTLVYRGQTVRRKLGHGTGHIVLDGDAAPLPLERGTAPHFLAHVYCGQTAGWIKMPLGAEIGLDPGHIMLDGNPAPP